MIDAPWQTIPELIADSARRYPDLEALVDGHRRWTFSEMKAEIDLTARALMVAGIERGDRVAIWAPNSWEWPIVALGVHTAGGVVVPVNTRFKGAEARYVLAK